jgi:hypothetical protein
MSVYAVNYTLDKGTDFETELNLTEEIKQQLQGE